MIQAVLGRSGVPNPLMRGNWCFTLECGHLFGITLLEPAASQALGEWTERFMLPKGVAGPAVEKWFKETDLFEKQVNCGCCDRPLSSELKWWFDTEVKV